ERGAGTPADEHRAKREQLVRDRAVSEDRQSGGGRKHCAVEYRRKSILSAESDGRKFSFQPRSPGDHRCGKTTDRMGGSAVATAKPSNRPNPASGDEPLPDH